MGQCLARPPKRPSDQLLSKVENELRALTDGRRIDDLVRLKLFSSTNHTLRRLTMNSRLWSDGYEPRRRFVEAAATALATEPGGSNIELANNVKLVFHGTKRKNIAAITEEGLKIIDNLSVDFWFSDDATACSGYADHGLPLDEYSLLVFLVFQPSRSDKAGTWRIPGTRPDRALPVARLDMQRPWRKN